MPRIIRNIIVIASSLLGLALFMVFIFLGAFFYFNSQPAFPKDLAAEFDGETFNFEVLKGESARSVGDRLAELKLIRSRLFWQILCRYSEGQIKAGNYRIDIPSTSIAIYRLLVSGRQMLLRVTIPEGLTISKTARLMENAGVCAGDEFIAAASDPEIAGLYRIPGPGMEGYLYPDTYLFPSGYPAEKVVRAMADNFFSRIEAMDERIRSIPPDELNKLVILASIVEREYRLDEEAPLMAGVFKNRMDIGMALQSCATVEYIITEIQGKPHPEVLSTRDTEIRDPYNTYIRPGLPPGPIASPGEVALKAALDPAKSDYLYFRLVEADSGKHYFSKTLDDHIKAGRLYTKRISP
ncbi:MAG: endolytic transglycosylase MltG [Treponema sp.]|jgi:UPF0755 protein|nr:endolytic transglycosylase MltG [Treponema sp.]